MRSVVVTVLLLIGGTLFVLSPGSGRPIVALGQTTIQFCRNVPEDFSCVGPSTTFGTNEQMVWIIVKPIACPCDLQVEWVGPGGTIEATASDRVSRTGNLQGRWRLAIRGQKPETLPGEWTVRVSSNGKQVASGRFTLQLVGVQKVYVPALGPVAARGGMVKTEPNSPPQESTSVFSAQDEIWAFVAYDFAPLPKDVTVIHKVRYLRNGAEVYQYFAPGGRLFRANSNNYWAKIRLPSDKVQPGDYTVEWSIDDVVLIKVPFKIE